MKRRFLTTTAAFAALISTTYAATTVFNGGDYGDGANWSLGLPTGADPGTVAVNGTVASGTTYTGYQVTQTAGSITITGTGNPVKFNGGSFRQNGGTLGGSGTSNRGYTFENNNTTTVDSGKIISGDKDNTNINSGASLEINGGSYEQYGANRGVILSGGSLTVNGGILSTVTISATNTFGFAKLSSGISSINLNGGTTTANFLGFGRNNSSGQLTMNLGGNTAGSFTAVDFVALSSDELITERAIAWFSGSLMTFSITNAADWAETEWNAGRMTYDGDDFNDLGVWTTVEGSIFSWDGSTNTLALIPEPSSSALLALGLTALVGRRRRNA